MVRPVSRGRLTTRTEGPSQTSVVGPSAENTCDARQPQNLAEKEAEDGTASPARWKRAVEPGGRASTWFAAVRACQGRSFARWIQWQRETDFSSTFGPNSSGFWSSRRSLTRPCGAWCAFYIRHPDERLAREQRLSSAEDLFCRDLYREGGRISWRRQGGREGFREH